MGSVKKSTKSTKTYFFEDKPLFGLDVGHDMLRVVQFDMGHKTPKLKGYGSIAFDPTAVEDGVIVKPELIAKSALNLFHKELTGDISTKRVAVSLPAARALTRAVQLPKMSAKDIDDAVHAEAEQYLPNTDELYIDYTTIREDEDGIEVFVVGMPKKIVDSHLTLVRMIGLEAVLFDTAIGASAQLFALDEQSSIPSVLVDFGAKSTDITVFNKGLVVTGTVPYGGDDVTITIAKSLRVTPHEAVMLKSKYGLSKSAVQKQVTTAIEPALEELIKEIRRTIRYFEQRYPKEPPIGQIVTMGGGANMPGLADYLTEKLRLPARTFDPAAHVDFAHLRPFYNADRMSYVTAAGLAVINPGEIFS
jgi:type IV pilus assembly protein PilM